MSENKKNIPEAEISDELLDTVTGGAKPPELKIPTTIEKWSASQKSTIAHYGHFDSAESWAEYSAYMASLVPPTTPSSEENP